MSAMTAKTPGSGVAGVREGTGERVSTGGGSESGVATGDAGRDECTVATGVEEDRLPGGLVLC